MSYNFELGKVYTFQTLAPGILGTSIKNATLTGILDYETARKYDEIDIKYRNIYPLLPSGTPDQVELCIYYKFKAENGTVVIVADQWIDVGSIELISNIEIVVTVTDISLQDINRIRDALLALNITTFNIRQL